MNLAILWRLFVARSFLISAWDSRSFGGSSARLLIVIRGPNLDHPWLMSLSSAAMVCSCGPDACLTSIVNCFIYPLLLALALSCRPGPVCDFTNLLHREITKRGQDSILHYPRLTVKLGACCLTEIQVASRVIQRTIGPASWISLKFIQLNITRSLRL